MPRAALKSPTESADFPIAQPPPITDETRGSLNRIKVDHPRAKETESGIFMLDGIEVTADYLADLAFYEEPLEIVIHPSTHQHAAQFFELWNNGKGAEMLVDGKWRMACWLPVNRPITVKRKIVEQIARSRVVNITTGHDTAMVENPRNWVSRIPTAVHSFQIIRDPSPRSQDWLALIMARDA